MDGWNEDDAKLFLQYARYFIPDREAQIELMTALLPERSGEFHVLDIGCGEGLLAESILERFDDAFVHGLDGSLLMRRQAEHRMAEYGDRFTAEAFTLEEAEWRQRVEPIHAVVSSLCLHHLDDFGKRTLFRDLHDLLQPGGVVVIADLVRPTTPEARAAAADSWDAAVKLRGQALDGTSKAWDTFRTTGWNHFRTPDDDDMPSSVLDQLRWLADAGFVDPDVYWMRAGHAVFGARRA